MLATVTTVFTAVYTVILQQYAVKYVGTGVVVESKLQLGS